MSDVVIMKVIDNHVIRYTPPEVYGKSEQYRHNKWEPGYGCVVVGALSADPFLVRIQFSVKIIFKIYC